MPRKKKSNKPFEASKDVADKIRNQPVTQNAVIHVEDFSCVRPYMDRCLVSVRVGNGTLVGAQLINGQKARSFLRIARAISGGAPYESGDKEKLLEDLKSLAASSSTTINKGLVIDEVVV